MSDTNPDSVDDGFHNIQDVPVAPATDRVVPRQVGTGMTRGSHVTEGADGKPQVLVGNQETFGNGLYVAKPAIDVITNTNPANLIFNSNQNAFKIAVSSTSTIPAVTLGVSDTVWNSVVVPHGLSYIPVLQAYGLTPNYFFGYFPGVATYANAYVSLPYTPPVNIVNVTTHTITCAVDATNVYFSYFYATGAGGGYTFAAIPIRYYLLQETAN